VAVVALTAGRSKDPMGEFRGFDPCLNCGLGRAINTMVEQMSIR
jgi:hypothetical protein